MSDETIKIDELKDEERLKIEVDDVAPSTTSEQDIMTEFKRAGRELAKALEEVLTGDEAKRLESEVRAGVKSFADEIERFVREAGESPAAKKLQEDVENVGKRIDSSDLPRQAQSTLAQGLRWLSVELDQIAGRFGATAEKGPDAEDIVIEDDEVKSA